MCKEQRPLSTVKFLADALSLSPTVNLATQDVNQPDNDNENGPTPEQILIFQDSYLRNLTLTNTSSPPAQDIEEMRFRGLPPPSDEDIAAARDIAAEREIASAREARRDREFARWRQTQLAQRQQWLLDMGSRYDEPEEYETSDDDDDDDHPNPDPDLVSANDDTHVANEGDVEGEVPFANTEGVHSTMSPDHSQELGENVVQSVGGENEDDDDDDDDIEFEDDLQDTVQMVGTDDVEFAEQGYHAWRLNGSEGSELEEGEVRE